MRPAATQAHDDLASYVSSCLVSLMGRSSEAFKDHLNRFRRQQIPLQCAGTLLSQMRYVADVATSLPRDVCSISGGLAHLQRVSSHPSLANRVSLRATASSSQEPCIHKQPETGTQVLCLFCVGCFWFGLFGFFKTARVEIQVPEEAVAPVAILPSPSGHSLRVAGA